MNERALQDIVTKFGISSLTVQVISFAGSNRVANIVRTLNSVSDDVFAIFDGDTGVHSELSCKYCESDSVPEWRRNGKIIWRTWPDGRPGEWACHYCGRVAELRNH